MIQAAVDLNVSCKPKAECDRQNDCDDEDGNVQAQASAHPLRVCNLALDVLTNRLGRADLDSAIQTVTGPPVVHQGVAEELVIASRASEDVGTNREPNDDPHQREGHKQRRLEREKPSKCPMRQSRKTATDRYPREKRYPCPGATPPQIRPCQQVRVDFCRYSFPVRRLPHAWEHTAVMNRHRIRAACHRTSSLAPSWPWPCCPVVVVPRGCWR
jgi:hypothetical protein